MGIVNHEFKTEPEAKAFKQGVEYVNDSCVEVIEIKHVVSEEENPWVVVCNDAMEIGGTGIVAALKTLLIAEGIVSVGYLASAWWLAPHTN